MTLNRRVSITYGRMPVLTIAWLLLLLSPGCNPSSPVSQPADVEPGPSAGKADFERQIRHLEPSPTAQFELQSHLINAVPGDVIQLEAGLYEMDSQIDIACNNITLRGRGHKKTVLTFRGQQVGSEGIVATGDALVIEDLAVEDAAGNAIKVLGAKGVVFRGVRTEWTGGPSPDNGAYGIYPVQCSNVLIDECIAIGASDAGIYVGQSHDVVVRNCRAEFNVAGIEIENTHRADVYDNVATRNAGGVLVFDLPGLPVTNGSKVRVFRNRIFENNTPNFAPAGNIVATVPTGTGLMIMAMDEVEVFENEITNNQSTGISVVSFLITRRPPRDPNYDPFPEKIWIHDNKITGGGDKPSGQLMEQLAAVFGTPFPQIFYDGISADDTSAETTPALAVTDNAGVTFANGKLDTLSEDTLADGSYTPDLNLEGYLVGGTALEPVSLTSLPAPVPNGNPAVEVYRQAPLQLSQWGLFEGDGSSQLPVDGVVPYDLNTPLFSDHTVKFRFIRLPAGTSMEYSDHSILGFPVGTVIAKTFGYRTDMTNAASPVVLLETRIQQLTPTGWFGFSYIWNDDQSDAKLGLGGGRRQIEWVHSDGSTQSNLYQIPNANQCLVCHSQSGAFSPLGPTAGNLNRRFPYPTGEENQLHHFREQGLLSGLPDLEMVEQLPAYNDSATGSVAERARAWLDVNCAHCHNPHGTARTSGLDLRVSQEDPAKYGVWKSPVATGRGSGGRKFDIVPGKPEESILVYRLASDEPGVRMPNLSRNRTYPASLTLVEEWIRQLDIPPTSE